MRHPPLAENYNLTNSGFGYRTPAEVEAGLWKNNPAQELIETKTNAEEQHPGQFT